MPLMISINADNTGSRINYNGVEQGGCRVVAFACGALACGGFGWMGFRYMQKEKFENLIELEH